MLELRWRRLALGQVSEGSIVRSIAGGDRMRSWPEVVGFVSFQLCRLPRVDVGDAGVLWLGVMVVTAVESAWKAWCSR